MLSISTDRPGDVAVAPFELAFLVCDHDTLPKDNDSAGAEAVLTLAGFDMDLTEEFAEIIADLGQPKNAVKPSPEAIAAAGERVPRPIQKFLATYGIGTFFDGLYQMCEPSTFAPVLATVFDADDDFDHRDCSALAYTAFGTLYVWSKKLGVVRVDLARGMVFSRALAPTVFDDEPEDAALAANDERLSLTIFPFSLKDADFSDSDGKPMFRQCRAEHGAPSPGECYGFFPALASGGVPRVENVRRVQALEHFALLAKLGTFHLTQQSTDGFETVRPIG